MPYPIHAAFASDARGSLGLAVAVHSLVKSSNGLVHVWIIEHGIDNGSKRSLEASWRSAGPLGDVHFVPQSALPIPLPNWWARSRWPAIAAARFQLPEIVPAHVERCIYLDIDTLTGTDLTELHDLDMEGHPVAMVRDGVTAQLSREYINSIGLHADEYCNSGVLLMDLPAWRAESASAALMALGRQMRPDLWFFDQDMLNTYFQGRCKFLEERWNYRDSAVSPIGRIQHFAGAPKPWDIDPRPSTVLGVLAWHEARSENGFEPPRAGRLSAATKSVGDACARLSRIVRRAGRVASARRSTSRNPVDAGTPDGSRDSVAPADQS